jgi:TolB protein
MGGMGNFELYPVNVDGSDWERITYSPGLDGFPVFSPAGKQLVWASNRQAKALRETHLFIADWVA